MSAKYLNRKTQVLNDVYRKEGDELMIEGNFNEAVKKYNEVSIHISQSLKQKTTIH